MRKRYDKLIRDRIPEIMDAAGVRSLVQRADDPSYRDLLRRKLIEEATEAAQASDAHELTKELADLQEVIAALIAAEDLDPRDVASVRERRREQRGGFERRLILRWTEEG